MTEGGRSGGVNPVPHRSALGVAVSTVWLGRAGSKENEQIPASTARFQPSSKRPSRASPTEAAAPVCDDLPSSPAVGTRFGRGVSPSYWLVYRIVTALPAYLVSLAHEGTKAYSNAFELVHRREELDEPWIGFALIGAEYDRYIARVHGMAHFHRVSLGRCEEALQIGDRAIGAGVKCFIG